MLEVSVWFLSRSLELPVGWCSVYVGGGEVAPGCVQFGCDVTFFQAVTLMLARLSVTLAVVAVLLVTSVVKRSLAGVDAVRWVAAAVTSDADVVDCGGRDPGSESVTAHYCTDYKKTDVHKKKGIWFGIIPSRGSWR